MQRAQVIWIDRCVTNYYKVYCLIQEAVMMKLKLLSVEGMNEIKADIPSLYTMTKS